MNADPVFETRLSRPADCPNSVKKLCWDRWELLGVPSHLVRVGNDLVVFCKVTHIVRVSSLQRLVRRVKDRGSDSVKPCSLELCPCVCEGGPRNLFGVEAEWALLGAVLGEREGAFLCLGSVMVSKPDQVLEFL